jgi:tetratricopeptide (TPR) repeat protein
MLAAALAAAAPGAPARAEDPMAPSAAPEGRPVELYNRGTAAYGRGDYPLAELSLRGALASAGPRWLNHVAYNLGSTHYRQAQELESRAPEQAAELYRKALEDYRTAIRQHPDDVDAVYNYELTQHRLELVQQAPSEAPPQSGPPSESASDSAQEGDSRAAAGEQQAAAEQQTAAEAGEPRGPQGGAEDGAAQEGQGDPMARLEAARDAPPSEGRAGEPRPMSQTEALWILDALRQEERGAPNGQRWDGGRESAVEQDW